jgi:hypothetical protein
MVVNGAAEPLLAAQVPFSRLYRNVAQEELNLLKLPAGGVAQTRARATIMPHAALSPKLCSALPRLRRRTGADSFLLGHISVQTTERYLGCTQRISSAVNDRIGIEPAL